MNRENATFKMVNPFEPYENIYVSYAGMTFVKKMTREEFKAAYPSNPAARQPTASRPPDSPHSPHTLPAWPANTQEQSYRAQSPAQAIQGRQALPDRSAS